MCGVMDHQPSGPHFEVRGNERLEMLISESGSQESKHCIVIAFLHG